MNRFALITALLMPVVIDGGLVVEAIPEVLVAQKKEELGLDDIDRLRERAEEAKESALYTKATEILETVLSIQEKDLGAEHLAVANTLNDLALLYDTQGFYDKAIPLFQRSLAVKEEVLGPKHPDTAKALNNLAWVYLELDLYSKAEPLFLRALAIDEKALGPEHPDTAIHLNNLGLLYRAQGQYYKAEPLLRRALAINEKILGPKHPDTAKALDNLGIVFSNQNLYSKAEPLFLRALAIHEKALGSEHPETGVSINNLAVVYFIQGKNNKAEPLLLRALAIQEKTLGLEHPETAERLINLGSFYNKTGRYNKAEPLLLRALAINEKVLGPDHAETAWGINNLAFFYNNQEHYKKAEMLYQRALTINKKVFGLEHPDTTITLNNLAMVYASQGDYDRAEQLIRQGLEVALTLIQREAPFLVINERSSFARAFDLDHARAFSSSFWSESGERLALFARLNRQGLLEDIEKRQSELANLPGPQQEITQRLQEITQELSSKNLKVEQRQTLRSKKEQLERNLYRLLPKLRPRIIQVDQVAKAMPSDSLLVEYQRYQLFDGAKSINQRWSDARYLAMLLKPNGEITSVDLGLAEPIEEKIEQALAASEEGLTGAQDLWNEVSQLVMTPLEEAIGGAETLFISPDAELNRIPFAALSSPTGDGLLGEAVQLRLFTTGRELLDLAKKSKQTNQQPLVVANPTFSPRKFWPRTKESNLISSTQRRSGDLSSMSWKPLPGTAKEGKAIAKLTNANLLLREKATALAVQEQESPKVLHLASHAYYLEDQDKGENPLLRSGIVLAGANQPDANSKDDGYLTALEVTKLDWQGTELVVVSGCESGKGDIQAGEGVYGLKRAIAVAGARSSLLSLWKVDDQATAAFMESFYQRLKAGVGRADALAATQKEFRNHPTNETWRLPYVWAAFQLSGDWRPIKW
ncbi:CHAT domain-containing tetratricopeptide repeat protein [Prochlorococcus sp. MIT 1307]|uniref:CHAT domain-containing protein n=1 Tax=Prochlorococcus sp. MIT 1307 TaxID=3096219 RepID=UPI002A7638A2|nr:CHAT domain-containing tetratricopeptide repeat protein [Prochlorococcus sp. MIT 1307]